MEKNYLTIVLFILIATVTLSCSKQKEEEAKNCTELLSKLNAAQIAFTANPSTANCQAAKTAFNNFLNCPYISAAEKSSYQALLNSLPPC